MVTGIRERRAELVLAPDMAAPGRARDFLDDTCLKWLVPEYSEAGGLVVSELVTNAVLHAGTEIRVGLVLAADSLTLMVHDEGEGEPRVVVPGQRRFGGRGLMLVAKLAEAWGVEREGGGSGSTHGKSVWCRLVVARPASPDG